MSDDTTLMSVLNSLNDANESQRERIEILQKDSEANRLENREMRATLEAQRATLEAQQSAFAAVQSVSTKRAKLFRKNLDSDSDLSSDELDLSKPLRLEN